MTENEALKSALKKVIAQEKSNWGYIENFDVDENWAVRTAIEQVQQYRQIGTVEECREAVEKQTAKKPTLIDYKKYTNFVDNADFLQDAYWCPNCKRVVRSGSFCRDCGQRIDWRDEDGKTD